MPNRPLSPLSPVDASEWAATVIHELDARHPQNRALDSWANLSAADQTAVAASGSFTIIGRRMDPSEVW